MHVAKWGNSLAIRLPASVVEFLGLKAGDEVSIHAHGQHDLTLERKASRAELIERLRRFRGTLPADFKFDRDEANAR